MTKVEFEAKLSKAVITRDVSRVNLLLNQMPNLNEMTCSLHYGNYPIFIAASMMGNPEIVKAFLNYAKINPDKANIDILDSDGKTAIVSAMDSYFSYLDGKKVIEIIGLLIKAGVNPDAEGKGGNTAWKMAFEDLRIFKPIIKLLLDAGVDPNSILRSDMHRYMKDMTALPCSAMQSDTSMIELLVSYGAYITRGVELKSGEGKVTVKEIYIANDRSSDAGERFDEAVARGVMERFYTFTAEDPKINKAVKDFQEAVVEGYIARGGVSEREITAREVTVAGCRKYAIENAIERGNVNAIKHMADTERGLTSTLNSLSERIETLRREIETSSDEDELPDPKKVKHNGDTEVEGKQHSNSVVEDDQEDDKRTDITQSAADIDERESFAGVELQALYSWLNNLPEWMQDKILNSAPVKTMIESAEQAAAIYDIKYIAQDFVKRMLLPDDLRNIEEDSRTEKAMVAEVGCKPFDTSLVYGGLAAAALILPAANSMLGDAPFNTFNGIEIF